MMAFSSEMRALRLAGVNVAWPMGIVAQKN